MLLCLIVTNRKGRNHTDQSLLPACNVTAHGKSHATQQYKSMITIFTPNCNTISQEYYDETITALDFCTLLCTCKHYGCLAKHAYYHRKLKTESGGLKLRICRVKCSMCGCTHALLLSCIVPYSQVSLADQIAIISGEDDIKKHTGIMGANPDIDESCISYILRQYRRYWKQRLLSEAIPLSQITILIKKCFSAFKRQFMQIRGSPNILFLKPT